MKAGVQNKEVLDVDDQIETQEGASGYGQARGNVDQRVEWIRCFSSTRAEGVLFRRETWKPCF
jgi:hypothetical protein